MPHDQPPLNDILATVRDFLHELVPTLDGQGRYHALCSIYLLEIALRELAEWQRRENDDDRRLARLLRPPDRPADPETLHAELAAAIRDGRFDADLDTLLEPMLAHARARGLVSRPDIVQQTDEESST